MSERILSMTEKRLTSIYVLDEHLLTHPKLELSEKFTAALAAFARLKFPLKLSDFRSAIPEDLWSAHVHFEYRRMFTGFTPIFCDEEELFYPLVLGPSGSHYRVYCVSNFASSPTPDSATMDWSPSLDTVVSRFTLCHPFFRHEMHDASGIYLFSNC